MTPNSPLDKSSLVNHKLHIILSVVSFGGWLPIYAVYYFFRKFTGSKINLKIFMNSTEIIDLGDYTFSFINKIGKG
jgi:hypothetical protein